MGFGLFTIVLLSGAFIAIGWVMPYQLSLDAGRVRLTRWLTGWSIKGLLLPFLLWALMNLGLSWSLQPFMPEIQEAQNSGSAWFPVFLRVIIRGLFIVSSFWCATTLGWALLKTAQRVDDESRSNFKALCWTCFLGLLIPALLIVMIGGLPFLGFAAAVIFTPMAGYARTVLHPSKLPPMYARAVARMKFGKYSEAEWEIIHELEKCQDDFEGWMMLAELYANHFNDLREAEQTVLEICDQPKTSPSQLSIALHRLADWHLKMAGDPDAARRALQMICDRLKGSHLAHMAQLRIRQLPRTARELKEQQANKPIPLPALRAELEETPPGAPEIDRKQAAQEANLCVEQLKRDPNNPSARERLARIFAEQLGQADLGIEQVRLLLNLPGQPDGQRAEWLSLLAAWHLKYKHDGDTARTVLERLVQEFPETPQAFAAQRRLQQMELKREGG